MHEGQAAPGNCDRYAAEKTQRLLSRLAIEISHTVKSANAGAVHDLRVAIRRFGQGLAACKSTLSSKAARQLKRRLKKLMTQAGEVRNCDVALRLLAETEPPAPAALLDLFRVRRKNAEHLLIECLKLWVERRNFTRWSAELRNDTAGRMMEAAGERALPRMAKRFFRRARPATREEASAADLHQLRLAAKKLRYTMELVIPPEGAGANRPLQQIVALQKLLGTINDCQTVRCMIDGEPGAGPCAAALKRKQRKKTEEFRRYWVANWPDVASAARWMEGLRRMAEDARRKPVGSSASATGDSGRTRSASA